MTDNEGEIFDLIEEKIQEKIDEAKKKAKDEENSAEKLREILKVSDEVRRKINIYHHLEDFIKLCDDVIYKRNDLSEADKKLLRAQYNLDSEEEIKEYRKNFKTIEADLKGDERKLLDKKRLFQSDDKLKKIFKNLF